MTGLSRKDLLSSDTAVLSCAWAMECFRFHPLIGSPYVLTNLIILTST